ncbi:translocation/assembly module TamB domain-containing protein [Qingshengfaniella alkalisoli]|uniref:Translocation and assembly module TamB C-terminal domain-containing protein n=1 Tax=Qingshengfaniella alkalisoli TaxID=2599296 RepID=A0A5B8J3I6_9RHOB|nr:translocation/assembly module TamB domain-containing protein [Qingshengfaniella alkalisoli]QDY69057.1 hypothetical protein FPZ52_05045 [Qingshengfaniella alkalisoli]
MKRIASYLAAATFGLLLMAIPTPLVLAQEATDTSEAEDAGFLERQIQNALGGEGRYVQVIGLNGVLNSEVSIDMIRISDDEGVWLTISDVVLDWSRLALLRRRLEVDTLTVGDVHVERKPIPVPTEGPELQADTAAEPFRLPDLPVAVNVGELSVDNLRLDQPVLNHAFQARLEGSAALRDGEGTAEFRLNRTDEIRGEIDLNASFTNQTRRLLTELDVTEDQGGLIVSLAKIPDAPSIDLSLQGDGPINDFAADLVLQTSGIERVRGQVRLSEQVGGPAQPDAQEEATEGTQTAQALTRTRIVEGEVAGNVYDLLPEDYRGFFGHRTALSFRATQNAEAGIEVQSLDIQSSALNLSGRVALSSEGWPTLIDLDGSIADRLGLPVVIPMSGPKLLLSDAEIRIDYNAAESSRFDATISGNGLMRESGILVDRFDLASQGTLEQGAGTQLGGVDGTIDMSVVGASFTDPALWEAVGDAFTLTGGFTWQEGASLNLSDFVAQSGDVQVTGLAEIAGLETGQISIDADVRGELPDLSRFAAISGQDLSGGANAAIQGRIDLVSGAFDAEITGQTQDIALGQVDTGQLLQGEGNLAVRVKRDENGISIDQVSFDSPVIQLGGQAAITPEGWPSLIDVALRVQDKSGAPVALPVPGQQINLAQGVMDLRYDETQSDQFSVAAQTTGLSVSSIGQIGTASVSSEGKLVKGSGTLIEQITAQLNAAVSDLSLNDPKLSEAAGPGAEISANINWPLTGAISIDQLRIASGDLQLGGRADIASPGSEDMRISGELEAQTGGLQRFAALAGQNLQGAITADASFDLEPAPKFFDIDLTANGTGMGIGQTQADALLAGDAQIALRANRTEQGIRVDTFSLSTNELSAGGSGQMTLAEGGRFDVNANLRNLAVLAPDFNGPLSLTTAVLTDGTTWSVDGTVDGPGGTRAALSGDVLRPDGQLDVRANGSLPIGLANLVLSPRSVQGTANFDLAVQGTPGLDAVSGRLTVAGARFIDPALSLTLENIGTQVNIANSQANVNASANLSTGGQITINGPVSLTAPFNGNLDIALNQLTVVDPSLYEINLGGNLGIDGPLAGGAAIAGAINISRAEIRIPAGGGGAGTLIDVRHAGEGAASRQTRERAGLIKKEQAAAVGDGTGPSYGLGIDIRAPSQVFIRGRGLDVEMGGEIQIGGTTTNIIPTGGFDLLRGRLNLLGQRLEFDQAQIRLQGNLVPDLYMVASSQSDSIRAQIQIEGPVNDPEINFTSEPELPQDEVLAHLFFGKSISDLTPFEVASLAAAINELSGRGGTGLFGSIREGLGVDNLDVNTSDAGTTSVTAGKYISERVYTDVTVDSDGTSKVELNFDVTDSFKASTSFDNEGDTGIGFHFERDY